MPCRDYYDDHPEQYFKDVTEPALRKQISFAESALCATLAALEHAVCDGKGDFGPPDFYDTIDYKSAGITKKDLMRWHKAHKELDAKHRIEEQEKLRRQALSKLSVAEKEALGIK